MRIIYFILFLLFACTVSAQTSVDFQKGNTIGNSEIKLYPNPAFGGSVHILTQANTDKRINVYDVFGELVLTTKISGKTLDISRLAPGVYVLQVNEGQKTVTRKLIVK